VWNPARILVVSIFAVALAAALFSLWYHYQSGRRALAFWGSETAVLIAHAPEVDVLVLEPADAPGDREDDASRPSDRPIQRLGIGGRFYQVAEVKNAAHARGVGNIRRAMVLDVTYDWDQPAADKPNWQYAMEFRDEGRAALVFFDFDSRQVAFSTSPATAVLDPAASDDWHKFFEEQFHIQPADASSK